MTNDLIKNNDPDLDPFERYANSVTAAGRTHIHGKMLRFAKHGVYTAGQEQEEVETGTRMLVFMPSLKIGWVKWLDRQPVQHILGLVAEGYEPPKREELGDMDQSAWGELDGRKTDPWQESKYLSMLDEQGEIYTFVTQSYGGRNAVDNLNEVYVPRRKALKAMGKPDEAPIIKLMVSSYKHPKYSLTFIPVFKLDGWSKVPADFDELKATLSKQEDVSMIEEKATTFGNGKGKEKEKVKEAPPPPRRSGRNVPPVKNSRF